MASPFDSALILVLDAGGNVFVPSDVKEWWTVPREQTTLWLGDGSELVLVERAHFAPYTAGLGEWYRAVTHFLGWPSHTLSGNTMALSASGDPSCISRERMFTNGIADRVQNDPVHPVEMVEKLLRLLGQSGIEPRDGPIMEGHKHLAAYLQKSVEAFVADYLEERVKQYPAAGANICLSGGVAQNCCLNSVIVRHFGKENVYVSPYSGDVGQCIGNALYARYCDTGVHRHVSPNAFLGFDYGDEECLRAISEHGYRHVDINPDIAKRVAAAIANGKVVAICQGRSEFGPRALGHRSVLGDPSISEVTRRIKQSVKHRDEFMPLAPAVSSELATILEKQVPLSDTMVYAPMIPEQYRSEFGSAIHVDGTARVQAVDDDQSTLCRILCEFQSITGRRVIINTSFNKRGDPIVESPDDAVQAFRELDIDALVLGPYLVEKQEK